MSLNILFAGLGRMGFSMAGHLTKQSSHQISVYNRNPKKVEQWLTQYQGSSYSKNQQYNIIILCVGNDQSVHHLIGEDGLLSSQLKANGVIIDHTTTSAKLPIEINSLLSHHQAHYIDAPVSGGEAGAINGKLTCMAGGDEDVFKQITPILENYCQSINYIGKSGSGQIAKMANQFCIAGILTGLSEAIVLMEKANLDTNQVFKAIKDGAAQSWQMDNRFTTMIEQKFNFGFAIEHMIKDLNYGIDQANQQGWKPQLANQLVNQYQALLGDYQGCDTSVIVQSHRKALKP